MCNETVAGVDQVSALHKLGSAFFSEFVDEVGADESALDKYRRLAISPDFNSRCFFLNWWAITSSFIGCCKDQERRQSGPVFLVDWFHLAIDFS